jgi:hypothetical protein
MSEAQQATREQLAQATFEAITRAEQELPAQYHEAVRQMRVDLAVNNHPGHCRAIAQALVEMYEGTYQVEA